MDDSDSLDQQEGERLKELEKELDEIGMKASKEISEKRLEKDAVNEDVGKKIEEQQDDKLYQVEGSQDKIAKDYDSLVSEPNVPEAKLNDSQVTEKEKELSPTSETEKQGVQEIANKPSGGTPGNILWYGLGLMIVSIITLGGYFIFSMSKREGNSSFSPTPSVREMKPTKVPTATPNPTENWDAYNSLGSQYSFRYPSHWITTESDLVAPTLEYVALADPSLGKDSMYPVFAVHVKSTSYDYEKEKLGKDIGSQDSESFTLSGITGEKHVGTEEGIGSQIIAYVFPFHQGSLVFTTAPEQEGKSYIETIEQIISTFEFIETEATSTVTPSITISPSE